MSDLGARLAGSFLDSALFLDCACFFVFVSGHGVESLALDGVGHGIGWLAGLAWLVWLGFLALRRTEEAGIAK